MAVRANTTIRGDRGTNKRDPRNMPVPLSPLATHLRKTWERLTNQEFDDIIKSKGINPSGCRETDMAKLLIKFGIK